MKGWRHHNRRSFAQWSRTVLLCLFLRDSFEYRINPLKKQSRLERRDGFRLNCSVRRPHMEPVSPFSPHPGNFGSVPVLTWQHGPARDTSGVLPRRRVASLEFGPGRVTGCSAVNNDLVVHVELWNAVTSGNIPPAHRERKVREGWENSEENRWKCFKCTPTLGKVDVLCA